jgi:hypothetical protein
MPRDEKRWLIGFILLAVVLTTLPYLLGYFRQSADWVYTGFVFGLEDMHSYVAKMLRGAAGDWLFRSSYTAEPQAGFLAHLTFLLLGKLTAPPGQHEQLVALFHLFRCAGVGLYLWASYDFLRRFVISIGLRRLGVVLAAFGGGLGWLAVAGLGRLFHQELPLEFYSPETFGFLMLLGLPHLAVGRAMLLWGILAYLSPLPAERPWQAGLIAGLFWLALGIFQPVTVVAAWAVTGMHLALTALAAALRQLPGGWPAWRGFLQRALVAGLVSMPIPVYTFLSFRTDPFLRLWEGQNLIYSPPPLDYLLAYALVLPLAIFGAVKAWQRRHPEGQFAIAWLLAVPFLAYAPYVLQRRLPEGSWTAWVALALLGLEALRSLSLRRVGRIVLGIGLLSTLFIYLGGLASVWQTQYPLFLPRAEVNGYQYLAEHAPVDSVVAAAFETSNALPAWAPVRVIIGHGPESVGLATLQPQVEAFLRGEQPVIADSGQVDTYPLDYLFWGPREQQFAGQAPVEGHPDWIKVYDQANVRIYQYRR